MRDGSTDGRTDGWTKPLTELRSATEKPIVKFRPPQGFLIIYDALIHTLLSSIVSLQLAITGAQITFFFAKKLTKVYL